ncbi:MAG: T9SS type A sorting domain-containing protein [Fibrobacteres bacterium]|nr:T9SS type A sorting domain-containing protein [Fibrobacterota bacterium]
MLKRTLSVTLLVSTLTISGVISLSENAGVARSNEFVSFGIPLAMGELPAQTIGEDAPLGISGTPAQFKVLSKWYDGSARWVLASFMTDFTANETKKIVFGKGGGSAVKQNLTLTDRNDTVTVNTGVVRIEMLKGRRFNVVNRVWRGQDLILDNTGMPGFLLRTDSANGDTGLYKGGALTDSFRVEENGPIRASVYVAGRFYKGDSILKSGGLPSCVSRTSPPYIRFMTRIYFYNNSDEIKVTTILHNTGTNGLQGQGPAAGGPVTYVYDAATTKTYAHCDYQSQYLHFKEFYYDFKTVLGNVKTATTENNVTASLNGTDRFSFLQTTPAKYYIFKNGSQTANGSQGLGYMDIKNSNLGVSVALKYCWEVFPKRLDLFGDTLRMNLFPRDIAPADTYVYNNGVPSHYVLPAGGWYRSDLFFRFHNGNSDVQAFAKARRNPVMPRFEDRYLHATQAIQGFYSDTMRFLEPAGGLEQRLFERKRQMSGVMYDYDMTEDKNNTSGYPRQSLWEVWASSNNYMGELHMGDLRWTSGYSNLHYDQTAGVVNSFLRTGNYKAWQVAQMMAWRRANLSTYHRNNGSPITDGMSIYESSPMHMNNANASPRASHHWCEGLGLYYSLTGDEFSGESFREGTEAAFWHFVWGMSPNMSKIYIQKEIRTISWSLLNLCAGYWNLSDEKYYDMLKAAIRKSLLPTEQAMGPGFMTDSSKFDQMTGYMGTPLVYVYHTLKPSDSGLKDTVAQLIYRLWQRAESRKLAAGRITSTHFFSPRYENMYTSGGLDHIVQTDYYGFVWRHFGRQDARLQAMMDAFCVVGYSQRFSGGIDSVKLDYYSPAIYKSNMYSGSETKLHGKIGLFGRKLMEYEYDSLCPVQPGDGSLTVVAAEKVNDQIPEFGLIKGYPNPFNPVTNIIFSLSRVNAGKTAEISVFDLAGKQVLRRELHVDKPGRHTVCWNGKDDNGRSVATGVYFAQVSIGANKSAILKLILMK